MSTTKFIYILSDQDLEIVEHEVTVAITKFGHTHPHGRTYAENKRIGCMCEIAVARFLEVPFIPEYEGRTKHMHDVCGYEVKGTDYFEGGMNTRNDMPTGIYLGAFVTWPKTATVHGWSTSKMMRREMYWKSKRSKPCYYLESNQMWDLEMLPATKQLIEQRKQMTL